MQQACQKCGKRFEQHGADRYCPSCSSEIPNLDIKKNRGRV